MKDLERKYDSVHDMMVKVQTLSDDVDVYGWVLEYRYTSSSSDEIYIWHTHNNKIHTSLKSVITASIFAQKSDKSKRYEYRILPIYRMNEPQFREYKINKILYTSTYDDQKKYEIKAWKLKDDYEVKYTVTSFKYKKGTIFIQLENGNIQKIPNTTDRTGFSDKYQLINCLIPSGIAEEVDIKDEKWTFPHLCKELKVKIK